jgi:hypothetical protein
MNLIKQPNFEELKRLAFFLAAASVGKSCLKKLLRSIIIFKKQSSVFGQPQFYPAVKMRDRRHGKL